MTTTVTVLVASHEVRVVEGKSGHEAAQVTTVMSMQGETRQFYAHSGQDVLVSETGEASRPMVKSDEPEVPPHVQRMMTERDELADRLTKLRAFFDTGLFASLDGEDRDLLREQAGHMDAYLDTLETRLARVTS